MSISCDLFEFPSRDRDDYLWDIADFTLSDVGQFYYALDLIHAFHIGETEVKIVNERAKEIEAARRWPFKVEHRLEARR